MLTIRDLGQQDYLTTWQRMLDFTQKRSSSTADEIWLLEHPPVYTQGETDCSDNLLTSTQVPIVKTDRGGQMTYHGPGQLIAYILIDLKRHQLGVRELVNCLESCLLAYLNELDIQANSDSNAPGIYVDQHKVASLGLRIKRGCSYHGLALNVDMDLSPFKVINPCGISGQKMAKLADYYPGITLTAAKASLGRHLIESLEKKQQ